MLWIVLSLFFIWLAWREIRPSLFPRANDVRPSLHGVSITYLTIVLTLACASAWPPFKIWRFERMLSAKSTQLADGHAAHVHCNTFVDTLFDQNSFAAGHAQPLTGEIVFQYPWCQRLMSYLAHPATASRDELFSLVIFTHETMHVRGEHNEARTECQAVQRNQRAAILLGVPEATARRSAINYYQDYYLHRGDREGAFSYYFSKDCAPGGAMDEHLEDSIWRDEPSTSAASSVTSSSP